MGLFNFFGKSNRIAELEAENKKLILDGRSQCKKYSEMTEERLKTTAELERLRVENEVLKRKLNGAGSAMIAADHKIYQDGLQMGKNLMIEDMQKALSMSYEKLREYSDDACLKGEAWVAIAESSGSHAGEWEIHDRICEYGGCEMPTYCKDEMVARIYVATLNLANIPLIRDMCDECNKAYHGID